MGVEVGGGWYDVVPITDSLVGLVVGDVQGHDVGAAKVMSRHRHTLELLVREERSPGKALERLNQFCLLGAEQRLATALVGVLDRSNGTITFSSAGHRPPLHVDGDKALELPVPPGPPLGVQRCRYKDHRFELDEAAWSCPPTDWWSDAAPSSTNGSGSSRCPARGAEQRAGPDGRLRD